MSVEWKLRTYTPAEIAETVGGTLTLYGGAKGTEPVRGVAIDSRDVGEGMLFAAVKGERNDGNDFIPQALSGGAVCFLCQFVPKEAEESGKPFAAVMVDDTVKALGALAAEYRNHTKAKIAAVTGSVGKTTTKEFIYAVASAAFRTYKTQGNYNSLIGLPLTIFGIGPEDEVVVLEMGMSALGEIESMSRIARPDIAVITNIGTSHLAYLGTRENICRAKMEIRLGMPENGVLLLNGDEPLLVAEAENLDCRRMLMSVYNYKADFRAVNIRQKMDGIVYDLIYSNKAVTNVEIPALGRHNVYNSLAAYATGVFLGMSDELIRRGLNRFVGADMRQKIYDVGGITVIDDCYNASPESVRAAVDVLVSMAGKKNARPAALLGDMLELGDYSRLMHDQIGQYAAQMGVQKLFCFGSNADIVAEAAIKKGIRADNVFVSLDTKDAQGMADMILGTLEPGDILLVKASRGIAAERVIECLKKHRGRRRK